MTDNNSDTYAAEAAERARARQEEAHAWRTRIQLSDSSGPVTFAPDDQESLSDIARRVFGTGR